MEYMYWTVEEPQHHCCALLIIPVSLANHDAINARFLLRTSGCDSEFEGGETKSHAENCKQRADTTRQTGSTGPAPQGGRAGVSSRQEDPREGAAFPGGGQPSLPQPADPRPATFASRGRGRRFSAGSPAPGPTAPPRPRGKRWAGPAAAHPTAGLTCAPRNRPGRQGPGGSRDGHIQEEPEEVRQPWARRARGGNPGQKQGLRGEPSKSAWRMAHELCGQTAGIQGPRHHGPAETHCPCSARGLQTYDLQNTKSVILAVSLRCEAFWWENY